MTVGQDAEYPAATEMESYLRDRCAAMEDVIARERDLLRVALNIIVDALTKEGFVETARLLGAKQDIEALLDRIR